MIGDDKFRKQVIDACHSQYQKDQLVQCVRQEIG
jgi:hypothetical protein